MTPLDHGALAGKAQPRSVVTVFVKTPGISPLKTRLARGVGPKIAQEFYRKAVLSLESLGNTLKEGVLQSGLKLDIDFCWAVAEADGLEHTYWKGHKKVLQGTENELGGRLQHVAAQLFKDYDQVLFLGADAPQVSLTDILEALNGLNSGKEVIGPAEDGGFWLLGCKRGLDLDIFRKITYSQPDTCRQLVSLLEPSGTPCFLKTYRDVDEREDLKDLQQTLKNSESALTPAQTSLQSWLQAQFPQN